MGSKRQGEVEGKVILQTHWDPRPMHTELKVGATSQPSRKYRGKSEVIGSGGGWSAQERWLWVRACVRLLCLEDFQIIGHPVGVPRCWRPKGLGLRAAEA